MARHFAAIALLVFAIGFLKGVRLPNTWAVTHMTFNYSEGFVRRGLVGQVIKVLAGERAFHYSLLATVGIVWFLLFAGMMALYMRRTVALSDGDWEYWIAIIAFAASPGFVFLVHEIGYFDYMGMLSVLAVVLFVQRSRNGFLVFPAVALLGALLGLIHEMLVVMFVPTMLFAMVGVILAEWRAQPPRRDQRVWWVLGAAGATAIPFGVSATVSAVGTKSAAIIENMRMKIVPKANFPLRNDAFEVLHKPFREILLKQMPYHWSIAENRAYLFAGFKAITPVLAFLLFCGLRMITRAQVSRGARFLLTASFVAATVAPLFLNFVGWDNSRWNAASVFDSFCCLGMGRFFLRPEAAGTQDDSLLALTFGAAVIILGLCTSYDNFLFDGFVVRWFPFSEPFRWR